MLRGNYSCSVPCVVLTCTLRILTRSVHVDEQHRRPLTDLLALTGLHQLRAAGDLGLVVQGLNDRLCHSRGHNPDQEVAQPHRHRSHRRQRQVRRRRDRVLDASRLKIDRFRSGDHRRVFHAEVLQKSDDPYTF